MTKIDIFSGFLGAGKTTLIKKLINESFKGEKLVLIENEFGEIGIDGGFLKDSGIEITEMNSGCICCSLVGDFAEALKKVLKEYSPERIIIEPSGVGKLSDVKKAVSSVENEDAKINASVTVVDVNKCKMYMKNFGEFFNDQIKSATTIILSHAENASDEKINECIHLLREHNKEATIVSTPYSALDGQTLKDAVENKDTLSIKIKELEEEHHHEHCDCHEHHHEHHHEHCDCHEHHHEHGHCDCHEHHHEHHHAEDVFTSVGIETVKKYTKEQIEKALDTISQHNTILRAKGIVEGENSQWIYFDYIPGETDIRYGAPAVCGRICVIGTKVSEDEIRKLF